MAERVVEVEEKEGKCKVCDRGFAARWEVEIRYKPVSDKKGMGIKKVLKMCSACIGELTFVERSVTRLDEVMNRLGDDLIKKEEEGSMGAMKRTL